MVSNDELDVSPCEYFIVNARRKEGGGKIDLRREMKVMRP